MLEIYWEIENILVFPIVPLTRSKRITFSKADPVIVRVQGTHCRTKLMTTTTVDAAVMIPRTELRKVRVGMDLSDFLRKIWRKL